MSANRKHELWLHQCQEMIRHAETEKVRRNRILFALVCNELSLLTMKKKYAKKRYWVHPLFKLRRQHGFLEAVFPIISSFPDKFENYFRMSATQFERLLGLIGPHITKQHLVRQPISATARLAMTLRYLATGDCMTSISYQYLVGFTTTINIINETCKALWNCLCKEVLPFPLKPADWLQIAHQFNEEWQFPHCIGAIDGKHVRIQCPDNGGSSYYNYKNHHSIVLMAICDARYSFTFVDIGAYGRRSDGGIFRDSEVGQKFERGQMNVPNSDLLTVDGMPLPYVLVGDEAFQLSHYLLRPYPGRGGLNQERSIFNYRLSRARRTIENTFGILVSQWRILRKPIEAAVDNAISTVQAVIVLHNWLRKNDAESTYIPRNLVDQHEADEYRPGLWRAEVDNNSALEDGRVVGNNNSSRYAVTVREEFCDYFNQEGAVPWQYNRKHR